MNNLTKYKIAMAVITRVIIISLFSIPTIHAGEVISVDAVADQRGIARPQDGDGDDDPRCDIGAVELTATEEVPQEVVF